MYAWRGVAWEGLGGDCSGDVVAQADGGAGIEWAVADVDGLQLSQRFPEQRQRVLFVVEIFDQRHTGHGG